MYYTYVLQNRKDLKFYSGFTKDLKLRFEQHEKGMVESTKNRRPLQLIYYEAVLIKMMQQGEKNTFKRITAKYF